MFLKVQKKLRTMLAGKKGKTIFYCYMAHSVIQLFTVSSLIFFYLLKSFLVPRYKKQTALLFTVLFILILFKLGSCFI